MGWSDGLPTAIGDGMQVLGRSTPTIINVGYNRFQFWDGRARTLEAQSIGPIMAQGEMNQSMHTLLGELKKIKGYKAMFEKAYPGEGITEKTIGKAIAAFERTVVSSESPFDRYVKGDRRAISQAAIRGFELFEGKAKCSVCHTGYNFTDDGFHNIGLPEKVEDPGRYKLLKIPVLKGAFKTPTLRDIGLTAPYMHNGVYDTLEEVIDHYSAGGRSTKNLSPNMSKLNLNNSEKADLLAFLDTLTGTPEPFALPVLPQ
jgi:cytochrome c peroxidase